MKHLRKFLLTSFILLFQFNILANTLNDANITKLINQLLGNYTKIKVKTEDYVVYFSGAVDTKLQENKIIELTSKTKNVTHINTTHTNIGRISEYLTDSLITAKSKGRIKYLSLNKHISEGYNLHVKTNNRIVYIFGDVKNKEDIATIKAAISSISYVKRLKISVKCS